MQDHEKIKGIYYALLAFVIWGLVPVYFKALEHVQPLEVVAHRIIWSAMFLALILLVSKRLVDVISLLRRTPALLIGLFFSALVISVNWLVFIWAVGQDRIVETTLGYFINPLINIVFGFFVFSERLRPLQWLAVALAAVGVIYQLVLFGQLPWVALVLAVSFASYGVLRKKIQIDAVGGLFIETLWLAPIALFYLFYLAQSEGLQFLTEGVATSWLLVAAGVVTSVPLLAFAAGASRISLSLIGIIQYLGPSIAFLIAVFYYGEPMDLQRLVTFLCIWAGLLIFTVEGLLFQKKKNSEYKNNN
jgi:chloramphenicol-sensitive protein RarD